MLFARRPLFFRVGRVEVFAESWKRLAGEPLVQTERKMTEVSKDFQAWLPGLHLIICVCHRERVAHA